MAFPIDNYAYLSRGFQTAAATSVAQPAISIPRPKYTYFVLFDFENGEDTANLHEALRTGRLMSAIKSISRPSVQLTVEALRSYNAIKQVPVKAEFKEVSMTFWDDTTSYIAGMLKEYRRFYHFSGDASIDGDYGTYTGRRDESNLPSIGLKVRSAGRHFFKSITIIDLGTEPSSANVYHIVNPIITQVDHGQLDYYDQQGQSEIQVTMAYEGFYEFVGENVSDYKHVFDQLQREPISNFKGIGGASGGGGFFSDLFNNTLGGVLDNSIGNVVQDLPSILSGSFEGGRFDFDALKTGLFQSAARGTPIQDIRNTVRDVELIKQRVDQGDYVSAFGLVNRTANRVADVTGDLGLLPFNDGGATKNANPTANHSVQSSADLMRSLNWTGFGGD